MPYRFLEDLAIADVAFEAEGPTMTALFEAAALAMTNSMIKDLETIGDTERRRFTLTANSLEMLLYRFLQELLFFKDAENLFFKRWELKIEQEGPGWRLGACAVGSQIDPRKQELLADVKAVSLHRFTVRQTAAGWQALVIVDV